MLKKRLISLLTIIAMVFTIVIVPIPAHVFGNTTESVEKSTSLITWTEGVTGGAIYFDPDLGAITGSDKYITSVIIPSEIEGIKVLAIADEAFYQRKQLSKVIISDGVKKIGDESFGLCYGLTEITIPKSVVEIHKYTFWFSTDVTIKGFAGSYAETFAKNNSFPFETLDFSNDEDQEFIPLPEKDYIEGDSTSVASSNWKSGSDVKFTIPNDIPIIGGGDLSLMLNFLPVQVEREGNSLYLGIGVADLKGLIKDGGWLNFKKFVDTQKEDYIRKGLVNKWLAEKDGISDMGFDAKTYISVYGYAEFVETKDGYQLCGGRIKLEGKEKVKNEWQTFLMSVPLVFKVVGESGIKATTDIGLDFKDSEFYFNNLSLTLLKIKMSYGVGVAYIADVSAYGSAEAKVDINHIALGEKERIVANLIGKLGFCARVLCAEYEKPVFSKPIKLYDNGEPEVSMLYSRRNNSDLKGWTIERTEASSWHGEPLISKYNMRAISSSAKILQNDMYDNGKPILAQTESGKKILIYTTDIADRSTGNHTAIMYSLYNEKDDIWTEPVIIEDDGTADYDPSVAVKGENVYVAWCNSSEVLEEKDIDNPDFLSNIARACDIKVATINGAKGQISQIKQLSEDETVDLRPQICCNDDSVEVVWTSNILNDVLTLSGTNSIHKASFDGETWNSKTIVSEEKPVLATNVGVLGEESVIAYVIDKDGDLSTTIDKCLYVIDKSGTKHTIDEDTSCDKPSFAKFGGESRLIWYAEKEDVEGLYYVSNMNGQNTLLCNAELAVTKDYQVINGIKGENLLICSENKAATDGSNISAWILGEDGTSKPVSMTDMDGYAVSPSGVFDGTKYVVAFLQRNVTIEDSKVTEYTNLCITDIIPSSKLELGEVSYLDEEMQPGNTTTIEIPVTNNGLEACNGYTIQVEDNGLDCYSIIGQTIVSEALLPGETKVISVKVSLPEGMTADSTYQIEVIPQDAENDTGSSSEIIVGNTDLELIVDEKNENYILRVDNLSGFPTKATLNIFDTDENETLLKTCSLGVIEAYGYVEKEFTKEELQALGKEYLTVSVSTENKELFDSNNNAYLYIGDEVIVSLDKLKAAKDKMTYALGDTLDTEDLIVGAVYTDGNEKLVTEYTTNANEIDMNSVGTKELVITYEENFIVRTVSLDITVEEKVTDPVDPDEEIHVHTEVIDEAVDATCTEDGLTEGKHCSTCNTVLKEQDSIKALGHDIVAHEGKNVTCTENGWYPYETCSRCDYTTFKEVVTYGHQLWEIMEKSPTCTEDGYDSYWFCQYCNTLYSDSNENNVIAEIPVKPAGHNYSTSYTIDKTATTSSTGSMSCHCVRKDCTAKTNVTEIPKISTASLSSTKYAYNGSAKKPTVTVKDSKGDKLVNGTDYTVSYASGRTKVGRYKVTITFKGKYSGSKNLYFTILPKAPSSATATLTSYYDQNSGYDDVKFSWSKVTGASGYNVYYKKSTSSSYTYLSRTTKTYIRKKDLSDGVKYTFKVVPYYKSGDTIYNSLSYKTASVYTLKKIATPAVSKSGTKVKVSWKNISGETGYQISKSTSKTGTNIVSTYATTSGTYKTIQATKGKTYYYKVRSYKTIDGKKIYGPWSSAAKYKR